MAPRSHRFSLLALLLVVGLLALPAAALAQSDAASLAQERYYSSYGQPAATPAAITDTATARAGPWRSSAAPRCCWPASRSARWAAGSPCARAARRARSRSFRLPLAVPHRAGRPDEPVRGRLGVRALRPADQPGGRALHARRLHGQRDGRRPDDDKPADIHDQCTDGLGHAIPNETVCSLINPIFTTPRVVAGEGIETDVNECSLKPLRRSDYLPVVFTDAQWAQLRAAFGTGVCDWSRPGVDQQATIPWMTYEDTVGGRPLGSPPASSSG